ncbi:hypothetical protein AB0K08_16230 [Citricoccus sp. NPDC055426]|uniref:hypothetical protein n=1 Tax=Citricoccus sp. NPDC055426 TaxID=3155536 RepID=UPI003439E828
MKGPSATSALEIHRLLVSSWIASEYSISVQTSSAMTVMVYFTAGSTRATMDTSVPALIAAAMVARPWKALPMS